jgi:hypothetical protein
MMEQCHASGSWGFGVSALDRERVLNGDYFLLPCLGSRKAEKWVRGEDPSAIKESASEGALGTKHFGTAKQAAEKFLHGQGMEGPGLKPFTFCNDLS